MKFPMKLVHKFNRKHIALAALLPSIVAGVIFGVSSNLAFIFPQKSQCGVFGLELDPYGANIKLSTSPLWSEPPVFSILDSPYSIPFVRTMLSSRSGDRNQFCDQLASYEIELRSDQSETENVERASKAINGVIVQPFDTFSFNSTVGERSEERGFQPGLMYSNGQVVLGLGGGVCLVSTALYNTVVNAGCKILERAHHSGPVRYAEPGLDAAVVYGLLDMRFKNDTGTPLLIKSVVENGKLRVSLLGKKRPGFAVEIVREGYKELPYKVIETADASLPEGMVDVETAARTGFEVTTVRLFKQDGKIVRREVLSSDVIPPRNKIVLVPAKPKMEKDAVVSAPIVPDLDTADWCKSLSSAGPTEEMTVEQPQSPKSSSDEMDKNKPAPDAQPDVTLQTRQK